jgi:glycyl-tRNA synthetase
MSSVSSLSAAVTAQGEVVKRLKSEKASKELIEQAVNQLKTLKVQLAAATPQADNKVDEEKQLRAGLEDLLLRRFFYVPSFEIYGGVGGLYDFGPAGCAIKQNLIQLWRQHFVLTESMLEVDCAAMTPSPVLV